MDSALNMLEHQYNGAGVVGGNYGATKGNRGEITNNPYATSLLALQCNQHA